MKNLLIGLVAAVGLSCAVISPAADFDGDSRDDIAIYRSSTGLWAIRGITRVYFGAVGDVPSPGDYNGDGVSDIAIFRDSTSLWAIRDETRIYFGAESDQPVLGGGGERLSDYVVKESDGADLVRALESNVYWNVFVPNGTYNVSEVINVNVLRIAGEDRPIITFAEEGQYLSIERDGCIVERIYVNGGGDNSIGNFHVQSAVYATIQNCYSNASLGSGFSYSGNCEGPRFINCMVWEPALVGFSGSTSVSDSQLVNCTVIGAGSSTAVGFLNCENLSNCIVRGESQLLAGFHSCKRISSSMANFCGVGFFICDNISSSAAINCASDGFYYCNYLSACSAIGKLVTQEGFDHCGNLSSCHTQDCGVGYSACFNVSTTSCD